MNQKTAEKKKKKHVDISWLPPLRLGPIQIICCCCFLKTQLEVCPSERHVCHLYPDDLKLPPPILSSILLTTAEALVNLTHEKPLKTAV